MPPDDSLTAFFEFVPESLRPFLIPLVVVLWAAHKFGLLSPLTDALKRFQEGRETRRNTLLEARLESKRFEDDAERQDDIAVFTSMTALQQQTLTQNTKLIDYFINEQSGQLSGIKGELNDIDGRWSVVVKSLTQMEGKIQVLTQEISRNSDRFIEFEKRLTYIMACVPELTERGADEHS